ncbi:MAG TPA: hypothetical protein VLM75_09645 [Spirochaetota bacterium]|nr:hypothetical protein [Spirochaetota bacterium]
MDAIIKDFNETAERNISLLENRITAMKRLMQQSGAIKNLDLSVSDREAVSATDGIPPGIPDKDIGPAENVRTVSQQTPGDPVESAAKNLSNNLARLAHGAFGLIRMIAGRGALFLLERLSKKDEAAPVVSRGLPRDNDHRVGMEKSSSIQKDFSELRVSPAPETGKHESKLSESDIAGLFGESDDKYALISDLHGKGCPIELISRGSGIPAGEIRLVLNLQGKQ